MTGTGNDIVALNAINIARTKQPNFYSKIISAAEKQLFDQQYSGKIAFEHFVWLFWSVKESAYKFLQRFNPDLVFSPTNTIIDALGLPGLPASAYALNNTGVFGFDEQTTCRGSVHFKSHALYFRSVITEEFIFSAVNAADDFANTGWGINKISSNQPAAQSSEVRKLLHHRLDQLFPANTFRVKKSEHGWPVIMDGENELPVPVSFAHHDHYIAYSFQLDGSRS